MTEDERKRQMLHVALFGTLTVGALVTALILLANSRSIFAPRVTLHASFQNVGGLIRGSSVRLAGVDIGSVRAVYFDPDPKMKRVTVDMSVSARSLPRIRADSVAQMTSKGLLGDMVIDITLGDMSQPALQDGSTLRTAEAPTMKSALEGAQQTMSDLHVLVTDVDQDLRNVLTPQVSRDVGRIAHSTAELLEEVHGGRGLAHQIFYDRQLADDAGLAVREARRTATHVERTMAEVDDVVARIRTGDGLLHGLVYTPGGAQAAEDVRRTASDLSSVAEEIKSGPGLAHAMVFDEDREALVDDLGETARILRRIAGEMDQGKGTVGGLLKDPTAYQDLTTLVGNLKRNVLLKAIIRLTIKKDRISRPPDEEPAVGGSGAAGQPPR